MAHSTRVTPKATPKTIDSIFSIVLLIPEVESVFGEVVVVE
jgi:hypothetical protein